MDSGVKQLALSFNVCSALPARRGQSTPENKKKGKSHFPTGASEGQHILKCFFFPQRKDQEDGKSYSSSVEG